MTKATEKTHFPEALAKVDAEINERVNALLNSSTINGEVKHCLDTLLVGEQSSEIVAFYLGLLARFLFSALIDADRMNSAERKCEPYPAWSVLRERLEEHLSDFKSENEIDEIRHEISSVCHEFSGRDKGLYQLTVPTGGGKTLASLRFALHHAERLQMSRIIYVVPYTSIIDQNAGVTRNIFQQIERQGQTVVLEHHSNLTPENETDLGKMLAENWDAPIIFTTAVQFLETLFAARTRGARRMHQLANAVIIFDEVQTIPIKTVHLFNNAVNFLVKLCGSTVVFCTATQPLLDKVSKPKGAARLDEHPQMMRDVSGLFQQLKRTTIIDKTKPDGWSDTEIANLVLQEMNDQVAGDTTGKTAGSVLVVVNTKAAAKRLYELCQKGSEHVYHLSTSMCPAHRAKVLEEIKGRLDPQNPRPVICISTQLIEAGVDIDFGGVIRYLAGLDSIAQAAGRCNRNGRRSLGRVFIINPRDENLGKLTDIQKAHDVTERILREFHANPGSFDNDLQSPKSIARFYLYYFFERAYEMAYNISKTEIERDDTLLSLLSINTLSVGAYRRTHNQRNPPLRLCQSFRTAAEQFNVIDTPTEGIIVPFGEEGEQIIAELCAAFHPAEQARLLKRAQRFSVNMFPHEVRALKDKRSLYEVWDGSGTYWLDSRHYSNHFGASVEVVAPMIPIII